MPDDQIQLTEPEEDSSAQDRASLEDISAFLPRCKQFLVIGDDYGQSTDFISLNVEYGNLSTDVLATAKAEDLQSLYIGSEDREVFTDLSSHYKPLQSNDLLTNQYIKFSFSDKILTSSAIQRMCSAVKRSSEDLIYQLSAKHGRQVKEVAATAASRLNAHNTSESAHENLFSRYRVRADEDAQHKAISGAIVAILKQLIQANKSSLMKNAADLRDSNDNLTMHINSEWRNDGAFAHSQIFSNYVLNADLDRYKIALTNWYNKDHAQSNYSSGSHSWLATKKDPLLYDTVRLYCGRQNGMIRVNLDRDAGYFMVTPTLNSRGYIQTEVRMSANGQLTFVSQSGGATRPERTISVFSGPNGQIVDFGNMTLKSIAAESTSIQSQKTLANIAYVNSKSSRPIQNVVNGVYSVLGVPASSTALTKAYKSDAITITKNGSNWALTAPKIIFDQNSYIDKDTYTGVAKRSQQAQQIYVKNVQQSQRADKMYLTCVSSQMSEGWQTVQKLNQIYMIPKDGLIHATTFEGVATKAKWADLAQCYLTDQEYPIGTLVEFGGQKQMTAAKSGSFANGVISQSPAYLMNSELVGGQPIAVVGRVRVRIVGKIKKFNHVKVSSTPGVGEAFFDTWSQRPIAIALQGNDSEEQKLVLCSIQLHV